MSKSYVWNNPDRGMMLRNNKVVTIGKEIPVDQMDPELLEKLVLSGTVLEVPTRKVVKEEPKDPHAAEKKKGGKK